MKKLIGIILFLVFVLSGNLSYAEDVKTIAILDFSNNSLMDREKYEALSPGLAEIMITELSKIKAFKIVERQKINSLIQEMQLSQSGMVSEDTGIQVGKLLGAKYLVFGSFMVFGKKVRIDVRIVEVETGLTIKAEEVTKKTSQMFEAIQLLNEKIAKNLDVKLTKSERKLLLADDTPTEVIELFSEGLKYEEANDLEKAKQLYIKAFRMDNGFKPVRKRLRALLISK